MQRQGSGKAEAARQRRISLQALCARLGAIYLTRKRNEHAKAGNMNNALAHVKGDIIVVFDADHAPFRAFLRETIGYFAKGPQNLPGPDAARLPQSRPDREEPAHLPRRCRRRTRCSTASRSAASTSGTAPSSAGPPRCRRSRARETTGGFSGITITEDCETAFELHSKGWNSVYVDKPLIAGLQPERIHVLHRPEIALVPGHVPDPDAEEPGPQEGPEAHSAHRLSVEHDVLVLPIPRMIFMFAPLTHIFFDIKIFVSNFDEAIAYTLTYMIVNIMLQNYLYGRVRWPWVLSSTNTCGASFWRRPSFPS